MEVLFVAYILIVSLISVFLTLYDKSNAKKSRRRIREKTLLTFAFLGGAAGMYIVMLLIRHKTKHKKFMFLLPLMIAIHTALLYLLLKISF